MGSGRWSTDVYDEYNRVRAASGKGAFDYSNNLHRAGRGSWRVHETLNPLGVAVVIEASHLCMMMRGVQKQNSVTTTSAFFGEFEKNETRSEFIRLIGSKLH